MKEQRVLILERLRGILLRQRDKFQQHLDLMEREAISIENGEVAKLQLQLELEKSVIAEIHSLVRVIGPLRGLYRLAYPGRDESVSALETAIERIGGLLKERNAANIAALRSKMDVIALEMSGLRKTPHVNSPFAEVTPRLIDITT
jgi:hypothetical protein